MPTREGLIDEAETIRTLADEIGECDLADLVDGLVANLRELPSMRVSDPVAAAAPSGANRSHVYESENVLPVGRLRHSPYERRTAQEGRELALQILRSSADWVVPRFYAEQHHSTPAAIRYHSGLLAREFAALQREGFCDVASTGKRGARLKYRLKGEHR